MQDLPPPQRSSRKRRWLTILTRMGWMGAIASLGGGWYANNWLQGFIRKDLQPLVQTSLSELLQRPVTVGAVENYSWNGLRFGPSSIPATPTDPDRATIAAIEISFNPLDALSLQRKVVLHAKLIRPQLYVEENPNGAWVDLKLKSLPEHGPLKLELDAAELQDAEVTLVPRLEKGQKQRHTLKIQHVQAQTWFRDQNQRVRFQVQGKPTTGGNFKLLGDFLTANQQFKFQAQGRKLAVVWLDQLIHLPWNYQAGLGSGDLVVDFTPHKPVLLQGNADFGNVALQIQGLPQPIRQAQGRLRFQGEEITLLRSQGLFGLVPGQLAGTADPHKGLNLVGKVNSVAIANAQQTINLKLPFATRGQLGIDFKIAGTYQKPILAGTVKSNGELGADRVDLAQAQANFQLVGTEVQISDIQATPVFGGEIVGGGTISLANQGEINLNFNAQNLPLQPLAKRYTRLPFATTGELKTDAQLRGKFAQPVLTGRVTAASPLRVDQVDLASTQADFQLIGTKINLTNILATPEFGGQITGGGVVDIADQGSFDLDFNAQQLPVQSIANLYAKLPFPTTGELVSDVKLSGSFDQPIISGTLQGNQPLFVDRLQLQAASAQFRLVDAIATVTRIQARPNVGGVISGDGRLDLRPSGQVSLNLSALGLPGDTLAALYDQKPTIRIGPLAATVNVSVPLPAQAQEAVDPNAVETVVNWQAPLAQYPARGKLRLVADRTQFQDTVLAVEGGEIALNGQLEGESWTASANLSGVRLRPFSPDLRGRISGNLQLQGSKSELSVAAARAQGNVRLSQGLAVISDPLQAQIRWEGDRLQVVNAVAPGFKAQGTVFTRVPQASDIPEIQSLDLQVALRNYNLQSILVATNVEIPGVSLRGGVNYTGRLQGTLENLETAGDLGLNGLKLNTLVFEPRLQGKFQYQAAQGLVFRAQGQADQVALNVDAQNRPRQFLLQKGSAIATGEPEGERLRVKVANLPLDQIPVETLGGTPGGTSGRTLGGTRRGSNTTPAMLKGTLAGNFLVDWETQTGQGQVDIQRPQLGTFVADRFQGTVRYAKQVAELIQGQLQQRQNRFDLSGRLNLNANAGNQQLQANVQVVRGNVQDTLALAQWFDIDDLQRGLTPPQFAKAADVQPTPIILPKNATVTEQLQQFAEFTALRSQQQTQAPQTVQLPPLNTLAGEYRGTLKLQGSLAQGVAVDFNLQGNNWKWDTYQFQNLVAQGRWSGNTVTLAPVSVQSGDAAVVFRGNVGDRTQAGDLTVENIAIADVKRFLQVDLDASGRVNGSAKLAGTWENPTATGNLTLANGRIKTQSIQSAALAFEYGDARLTFDSHAAIGQPEPLVIAGSLPLPLPLIQSQAKDNQIRLDIKLKDEALSLLNLFTNQVNWVEGQGQVNVAVRGTLEKPLADGTATLVNAKLTSPALPDPLQQVNGLIRFDNELVQVENLKGLYGTGNIAAMGVIPLANSVAKSRQRQPLLPVQPLTVDLNGLALNLPKLYRGGVGGQLIITGSVPEPVLSGELTLVNGLAFLPDTDLPKAKPDSKFEGNPSEENKTGTSNSLSSATAVATTGNPENSPSSNPVTAETNNGEGAQRVAIARPLTAATDLGNLNFADLKLNLGEKLRITGPLINFVASGNITLNGSLEDPQPQGTVDLLKGQVNIYTTLFTLDRLYPQTATFVAGQGLDPNLDVHMVTSVPEITQVPLPQSPLESSEIAVRPTSSLGAIQTIRIEAIAKGPASQIERNLELKSSPSRNTNEILALLGGGFVQTIGQGNTTLALANLASTAFLTNLQALINRNLGIVDFRIFPAVIPKEDSRNPATLDLAAELGVPITRKFSASVLNVLTSRENQALFNLRYRINDQFQLRGSTDFGNENSFVVEFDQRF